MKITYALGIITLTTTLAACGGRKNNDSTEQAPEDNNSTETLNSETNTDPSEGSTSIVEDSESSDVSAQTEEAFSSISNDLGLDSSLGLMLTAALESEVTPNKCPTH